MPPIPCGLKLSKDLDLSGELILNAGGRVYLERPSRVHEMLLVQLPLETGEHLEESPFSRELDFVPISPCLRRNSRGKGGPPRHPRCEPRGGVDERQ